MLGGNPGARSSGNRHCPKMIQSGIAFQVRCEGCEARGLEWVRILGTSANAWK